MGYGTELRDLMAEDGILVVPGCMDPMTARIIEMQGFDAVYMTGFGTAMAKNAFPDVGLTTMDEILSNVNRIQERIDVPLIADAETGYGSALNTIRTVREYVKTGVAGLHIEDQVGSAKRCGSFAGKEVVSREEAEGKYRAAADVRDERDPDLVLIARTDARAAVGLDEAIERANLFYEAGADMLFVAGLQTEDEVERVGREVEGPLLYETPMLGPTVSPERLEAWGWDVVLFPLVSVQSAAAAVYENVGKIREDFVGAVEEVEGAFEGMPFDRTLADVGKMGEFTEWEERYLPAADRERYDRAEGLDITSYD